MMAYWLVVSAIFVFLIAVGVKWEIKLNVVILWALFMVLLASLSLYLLDRFTTDVPDSLKILMTAFGTGIITIAVISLFFFRDPDRIPPAKENVILSPADGTILYIKEIQKGEFPFALKGKKEIPLKEFSGENLIRDRGFQIGIGMNLLNVHVNRAPIGGRVVQIRRIPGGFFSLKKTSSLIENERVLTVIDGGEFRIGVVQIASRLVRRITSYLTAGDEVEIGQRIGMIRFGSQVDLLIPSNGRLRISVKPGDEVKAGVSVITALVKNV
jgi:phosphatidylserine decarboxylase